MAENLIITVNNGTRDISKNLTNVNPNAADSDLAVVASALNGLTTNTLVNLERVVRNSIELPATAALESPNLTVSLNGTTTIGDSYEMAMDSSYYMNKFLVSYSGSGTVTVNSSNSDVPLTYNASTKEISQQNNGSVGATTTVTVNLTSDGAYDSATKVFTLTYTESTSIPTPEPLPEP